MKIRLIPMAALLGASLVMPDGVSAQRGRPAEEAQWFAGRPYWTLELYGGVANQGRFLLQSLPGELQGVTPQRELRADNSFSWGGAVSAMILPRTAVRIAFTRMSTDLEYEDDTGVRSGTFELGDVAGLDSNVLSFEAIRTLFPTWARLTPYGGFGVALVWWNLDEVGPAPPIIAGDGDHTQFRLGGVAILGMQFRPARRWAVRLEASTFGIGNPFTGNASFVPVTGFTIDEPTHVRQTHIRLAAAYTFGRVPGRRVR